MEGSLWSFNYFFYNRKLKRILFFTCSSTSKATPGSGRQAPYSPLLTCSLYSPDAVPPLHNTPSSPGVAPQFPTRAEHKQRHPQPCQSSTRRGGGPQAALDDEGNGLDENGDVDFVESMDM